MSPVTTYSHLLNDNILLHRRLQTHSNPPQHTSKHHLIIMPPKESKPRATKATAGGKEKKTRTKKDPDAPKRGLRCVCAMCLGVVVIVIATFVNTLPASTSVTRACAPSSHLYTLLAVPTCSCRKTGESASSLPTLTPASVSPRRREKGQGGASCTAYILLALHHVRRVAQVLVSRTPSGE